MSRPLTLQVLLRGPSTTDHSRVKDGTPPGRRVAQEGTTSRLSRGPRRRYSRRGRTGLVEGPEWRIMILEPPF